MKYLYIEDDLVKIKSDDESFRCALGIAMGRDYAQYGIDPVEAFVLVCHLEEGAIRMGHAQLLAICVETMDKLRPLAQACLIAEYGLGWEDFTDLRQVLR